MSTRCRRSVSPNEAISAVNNEGEECQHAHSIDDEHTGSCVCTDCGLVLEQLYMFDYKQKEHMDNLYEATQLKAEKFDIARFLTDVTHNAHIPSYILSRALWYFDIIKGRLKDKKKHFKDRDIAAFALYETLNDQGVSRTVLEIEDCTGISRAILWAVESSLIFTNTLIDPKHLVDRYCTTLDIPWRDLSEIKTIVGNMYGMGNVRPQCLVAVVIYLYTNFFCKLGEQMKPTLRKICDVCIVSPMTVLKIVKNMEPRIVANIGILCQPCISDDYLDGIKELL